jgi:serine/threonine protein kinase
LDSREHNETVITGQTAAPASGQAISERFASGQLGNGRYAPGDVLGGTYKIIDFLGQGGMGFVYRVEHLLMAKELALKVLRTEQISAVIWRRFQTEAQAIARLDHANVVKIYDMGQSQDGIPYYTMDLLLGESLADYLDREDVLTVEQALPIFRQVCAGLAYAHDRGIIHRDIKPANIMLLTEPQGAIKIVDFGIAKLSSNGEAGQGLTRPGEVFGSPLYMSPEQCLGLAIDHRTDIYSVGITFFEALTGRAPFIGRSAVETTAMHQSDSPPLLKDIGDSDYPQKLERIIAKMLAKSPDQRYQSLADAAKELLLLERALSQPSHLEADNDNDEELDEELDDNDFIDQVEPDLAARIRSAAKPLTLGFIMLAGIALLSSQITNPAPRHKAAEIAPQPVPVKNYDAFTRENAETRDPLFEPEIGPDKPFFSKVVGSGAKAIRHFNLPDKLNLGSIKYGPGMNQCKKAQGSFDLPENGIRELIASQEAATHSKIFKRFQDGDFQVFTCKTTEGAHDDLIENISHIKSITELNISANDLSNASVPAIAKLTNLTDLGAGETDITGDALAATAIPMQLVHINFENNKSGSALVQAMRNSRKARHLCLAGSDLDGADIETLSTMPELIKLEIGHNKKLRDQDLKPLTKLKKLKALEIQGCSKLTAAMIPTLAKMKNLINLELNLFKLSELDKQSLCKALPHCNIKNADSKSFLQNQDRTEEEDMSGL